MAIDSSNPQGILWGRDARAWASLAIFVHLFLVLVAVAAFQGRPSNLQVRLHAIWFFTPYLRNLHLSSVPVSYPYARFHLTHAIPGSDIDYTLQISAAGKDTPGDAILLPRAGLLPPIRYWRYSLIANALGTMADGENFDDSGGLILRDVAAAVMREDHLERATVRLRAFNMPPRVATERPEPRREYPYEAKVFIRDGQVDLLRVVDKVEVAPVEGPSQPAGQP